MSKTVIVIGAGAAGLATAGLLARDGYDVTVCERLDTIGGRAGEETVDGFRFDTGPSWYLMPDAFDHFFELMGTSTAAELDLVDLTPAYRLFPEHHAPLDVPSGRGAAEALFESIEPGAGAALADYLDSAADTYDMAVERFLYTNFDSVKPFVDKRMLPRYADLAKFLTMPLDRFVAERFADTRLRQMLTYPAVFLSSRPSRTPSMYHLMSHTDLTQGVQYPQGGFAAVMDALHRLAVANGAQIRCGADVTAITYYGSVATGVRLSSGEELRADVVVSCADLHFTETRLLPKSKRTYDESYFAPRDPGLGTVLVMLGVEGGLPQLEHHNLLFSEDWEDDFDAVFNAPAAARPLGASRSIYVSKPSATDTSTAPAGHENLFVLVPVAAAESLGHGDMYRGAGSEAVERIADAAVAQIGEWCGIDDLAERIVVRRTLGPADFAERYHAWSGGSIGPAHTLRQSAFLRGSNRSRKLKNLYYAGATTVPGVGVPMCLISAENVLKRLRGDRSPGPVPPVGLEPTLRGF
ncbi:phytoene desaturase family protein [Corynebacterium sp. TA-R-1]|uniref:Phytoene desaturase family protein n=1 Tax=Corynebacterium stercoris TaxID=2943490 RepID=A0ABT1G173_9CORY|nr:phytoene desaturase family protein [Corynebacterium stercoris]MCP1387735.1 phytoene desaturase family protein [Corynebacterium stercoris]